MTQEPPVPDAYAQAGVSIERGNRFVDLIKPLAALTRRPGGDGGLGGFGGLFDLKAAGFQDPLLVAATDGVGTKLLLAGEADRLEDLGQDLVAMCVNDLVVQGAEPLLFLDYYATGRLDPDQGRRLVQGIAGACKASGCVLIGGETAEMPGVYPPGAFDLAGFALGAVEREAVLPKGVQPGDALLALASSGVHSNGFSLVRRILKDGNLRLADRAPYDPTLVLADALLAPTKLYVRLLPRRGPSRRGQGARPHHRRRVAGERPPRPARGHGRPLRPGAPAPPAPVPVARQGGRSRAGRPRPHLQLRRRHGPRRGARFGDGRAGSTRRRGGRGPASRRDRRRCQHRRTRRHGRPLARPVAVLASGGGSNLQALLDACAAGRCAARIVLVIADVPGAGALTRAERAGVPARLVDAKAYPTREAFEHALDEALRAVGADLVCLAGFMRILSPRFALAWQDRLLNIHPSLLPAFKGLHTHERALEAGVRLHGCTVHLVRPALDDGPILVQGAVPVLGGDDAKALAARVLAMEHRCYPLALDLLARGAVRVEGERVVTGARLLVDQALLSL